MVINKYCNIPLYSQLKDLIINKIHTGEYKQDSKIPSEQEFCEAYDISRPTVRQAISELTKSGILYKEKGKGTFVSKSKSSISVKNYSGFTDSILESTVPGDRNIISTEITDNSSLCNSFDITDSQLVELAAIKYLTTISDEVISFNISYIPLDLFPDILQEIKEKRPSYDILKGKYPYLPVKSKSHMEISYADQFDAGMLRVQTGQPLIKIESVLYSKTNKPVEYIVSKYRADKCKICLENSK